MKIFTTAMALAALFALGSPTMGRADSAKFPLKGLLKTAAVSIPGVYTTVAVAAATAPSTAAGSGNVFVVKEICFNMSPGNSAFCQASTGGASLINGGTTFGCKAFETGFVVPEGADLLCFGGAGGTGESSVSGIVTKKQ